MSTEAWRKAYGKNSRPRLPEINGFLDEDASALFAAFSNYMAREYGMSCKPPVYTETRGWVYSFGRSAVTMISSVAIEKGAFVVDGVRVSDADSLDLALALAASVHADGFSERFARITAEKNRRQKEITQRRKAREAEELARLSAAIDPKRFNRFRWPPKVSRQKLRRLYDLDAGGLPDAELAEDIGLTLYTRCLRGQEERALIESRRLLCHGCGTILPYARGLMTCCCGAQFLYRDYMRAFRVNNMPCGSASDIFAAFIHDWPRAKEYPAQIRLIDRLVHEFHINLNSGVKGRFVGVNLIEGSKAQIGELIFGLAFR